MLNVLHVAEYNTKKWEKLDKIIFNELTAIVL
jgi:hypothetical protein